MSGHVWTSLFQDENIKHPTAARFLKLLPNNSPTGRGQTFFFNHETNKIFSVPIFSRHCSLFRSQPCVFIVYPSAMIKRWEDDAPTETSNTTDSVGFLNHQLQVLQEEKRGKK